jgi:hypothetical protein
VARRKSVKDKSAVFIGRSGLIHHIRTRQSNLDALAFFRLCGEIDAALNDITAPCAGQAATAADTTLRERAGGARCEKEKREEKQPGENGVKVAGMGLP